MHLLELSTAVPSYKYTTEEMLQSFPCELQDNIRQSIFNLGVSTRYLANPLDSSHDSSERLDDEEPAADTCADACGKVLRRLGLGPEDIDYLITTYDASSFLCPGLSNLLVHKLHFPSDVKHVSIQGMACTAFTKALELARDHLSRFPSSYVMISLSGVNSNWFCGQVRGLKNVRGIREIQELKDEEKKRQELRRWIATIEAFLFGDGSASLVVTDENEGLQITDFVHVTNIRGPNYLAGYAKLKSLPSPFCFEFLSYLDKKIPDLGIRYTTAALKMLSGGEVSNFKSRMKKWAMHTGSKRILDNTADYHGIDRKNLKESYEVLANYGNLAGASLPFILRRIMSGGEVSQGDPGVVLGYGWGFSAGAAVVRF